MAAAAPAFESAKGLTFTMDVVGANDLKMTASVMCKDSTDAGKVKTGLDDGWKVVKGLMDGWMLLEGPPPGPQAEAIKLVLRDLGKLSFTTSSNNATATLTFSNQTIDELAKAAKNNPFGRFGGGFNPGPQPKPPPFKDGGFPKGNPKVTNFAALKFNAGQTKENTYNFQANTRLRLDVHASNKNGSAVEVSILEGAAGEKVVFSDNQPNQIRQVNFTIPRNGVYRVRMRNLGPGLIPSCTVFVWENP